MDREYKDFEEDERRFRNLVFWVRASEQLEYTCADMKFMFIITVKNSE